MKGLELLEYLAKWARAHPDVKEVRDVHLGVLVVLKDGHEFHLQVSLLSKPPKKGHDK